MTRAELPAEGVVNTMWSHMHPNFEVRRAVYAKIPQSWQLAEYCFNKAEA